MDKLKHEDVYDYPHIDVKRIFEEGAKIGIFIDFKNKRIQGDVEELKFSCNYSRLYKDLHGKSISQR